MGKSIASLAGMACFAAFVAAIADAAAQEWRRGDFEYLARPHRFGPLCEYGIRARGYAPVALFGGAPQMRKAEAHLIQDWESEASRLFGARYGRWALAMGKEVHCEAKGLEFLCTAFGHPCRDR